MKLKNILREAKVKDPRGAEKVVGKKLKELGLSLGGWQKSIKQAYEEGRGRFETKLKIDPSRLGPMQAMFETIDYTLEIDCAVQSGNEFICVITIQYSYKHPSGANGYRVAHKYLSTTDKWQRW